MNQDIQEHFQNIREIIREGRAGALKAVNAYALTINWQIGTYLSQQLSEGIYGDYIVDNLAIWLKETEPGLKGYERRSLYRMRSFFTAWQSTDWSLLPPFLQENEGSEISFPIISTQKIVSTVSTQSQSMGSIPAILLKISWSHHIELLSGCTSQEERLFYLILAIKDNYDVRDLRRQIKSGLFERQMLAKQTLLVPNIRKKSCYPKSFETAIFSNFYLELLDRDVRKSHENPSIGVVLCKTAHEEVVEIAMSRQLSPAMVSAYQTKFVDKNLLRQFLHQWTEDWEQSREQEEES